MARRRKKDPRWAVAKHAFQQALPEHVSIGWVETLGSGLARKAYYAEAHSGPDFQGRYVALVPNWDTVADYNARALREAELLRCLAEFDVLFRVPRLVGVVEVDETQVLVQGFLPGLPIDFKRRRSPEEPWTVVAQTAAAIHSVDPALVQVDLPRFRSRRAHAMAELEVLVNLDNPICRDAHAWALENLPPDEPPALTHGDLLGQNLLVPLLEPDAQIGVIDWEFAQIGDPAYDLAIVTRGRRRPFHSGDGLARLIDAYNHSAKREIRWSDLRLYELCMTARWYRGAKLEGAHKAHLENQLNRVRAVLRRAIAE